MKRNKDVEQVTTERRGATLAEVLASLIVMSIGIVYVAFLFPISVLRTLQATQLTCTAQLKYDFDGLKGARPELVTGVAAWKPGVSYSVGDLIVPTLGSNFYFERQNAGTSAVIEPSWITSNLSTTNDGGTNNAWIAHWARTFVVDPMGWEERSQEMSNLGMSPVLSTADIRNTFGRNSLTPTILPMTSRFRVARFRGGVAQNLLNPANSIYSPAFNTTPGVASRFGAMQTCVLPDNWLLQTDSTNIGPAAATSAATSIQLTKTSLVASLDQNNDGTVNVTAGGAEQSITARVTLFGTDNKVSVVRQINTITRPGAYEQINWTLPLPGTFVPIRARVETFEPRYSWMLAVRQLSGSIYMDLVTFYKRSYDPKHELVHPAHFHAGDTWPGADGILGNGDDVTTPPTVIVQYNAALGTGSPAIRRGGFICDAQNNRWYRILSFTEVPNSNAALVALDGSANGALAATRGANVRLEYTAMEMSGKYTAGVPLGSAPGGAIILPNIINVYPLQPVLPWEN